MSETLIAIQDLSYRYGKDEAVFWALRDIGLTIQQGEFVAITGASGSGKSTLMNLLGTLATPQSGLFRIASQSTQELGDEALASLRNRTIGFVFQQFHLLPRLTVLENVLLPLHYLQPRPSAADRERLTQRAFQLLGKLGIRDQAQKFPNLLSGGQKQRVAIARALLLDPQLILADEPTGALDSKSSADVMRILADLNREGRTVILITHDPEVTKVARRRVELRDGRVIQDVEQEGILPPASESHGEEPADEKAPIPRRSSRWRALAPLKQAWQALVSAKLRTALTSLGLTIGVTSITTMLTLGTAAQEIILKIFDRAGADRIYVGLDYQASRTNSNGLWQGLHIEQDLPAMQNAFAAYGRITPLWGSFNQNAVTGGQSLEVTVDTIKNTQDLLDQGGVLARGRMLAPHELREGGRVALVGSDFAQQLAAKHPGRMRNPQFPIGEQIALRGRLQTTVTIVGVLGKRDTTFADQNINARLFVPLSTYVHYTNDKRATWISVVPHEGVSQRWLADSVANYLRLETGLKFPFRAEVPEETIGKIMLFITIFQALTALIGGLCILVGGIGIMNIMLVTIAERIKEIGLRKALGATGSDIVKQFLLECMLLCLISGLVGTLIGALFCNLVALVGHAALPETIPNQLLLNPMGLILGIGTALVCGMTFGMMPALRASHLDPSEALRSE